MNALLTVLSQRQSLFQSILYNWKQMREIRAPNHCEFAFHYPHSHTIQGCTFTNLTPPFNKKRTPSHSTVSEPPPCSVIRCMPVPATHRAKIQLAMGAWSFCKSHSVYTFTCAPHKCIYSQVSSVLWLHGHDVGTIQTTGRHTTPAAHHRHSQLIAATLQRLCSAVCRWITA